MNIKEVHSVYCIGIGGIGMSALARYFHHIGKKVAGYDKTPTPLTMELEALGIAIHYDESVGAISESFRDSTTTLVVYTPAVPKGHAELRFFIENGFQVLKRSAVLGLITKDTFCMAVAGTHGKTTTSSILAHLLKEVHADFTAFLGGISEDFDSNFVFEGNTYSVVEADEFDRSFLRLSPKVACITSMDADHLDIYGSPEDLERAFCEFANMVPDDGALLVRKGLPIKGVTFGIGDDADYCVENLRVEKGSYRFDLKTPQGVLGQLQFNKPGRHNIMNAVAALSMALESGFPPKPLGRALSSFKGVARRFSYQIKQDNLVFIDDYAHHPTEINAVFQAIGEMHPNTKVTVIFQPHLFSRTKDFADDFAKALAQFDCVLLLDIYPARELPIPGITADWLLQKIDNPNKRRIEKSAIVETLSQCKTDVLVTLGAGDIGLEVPKIKKALAHAR